MTRNRVVGVGGVRRGRPVSVEDKETEDLQLDSRFNWCFTTKRIRIEDCVISFATSTPRAFYLEDSGRRVELKIQDSRFKLPTLPLMSCLLLPLRVPSDKPAKTVPIPRTKATRHALESLVKGKETHRADT